MSSQENLAARLKTGSKLGACIGHHLHHHQNSNHHHHHQHHHLQSQSSMAAASRARAKQRKWRVLVSIGLLLPALAAIIGIVAWAISIEVANSEPSGGAGASRLSAASLAQRRAERLGQQQLRHEEALQLAANLAAMRRSARAQPDTKSASVNTINSNAPTEATSGQPRPVAAAIVSPAAPQQQQQQQQQQSQPATTKRRAVAADQSSSQQQQQQQPQQQTANATTKTKSESASHTQTTPEAPSVASSEQEPPTTKPEEPQTTTESGEGDSEVAATSTPAGEVEAAEQDNGQEQQQQQLQRKLDSMEQPTRHKSRWLNYDKPNKSKSPVQVSRDSSDSAPKTKQTKSVKQIFENVRSAPNRQTRTSPLMSNRYTLVQGGESKASSEHQPSSIGATNDQDEAGDEESMVAAAKQAVKMLKKSGAKSASRQEPAVVVVSANEQEPSNQQQDEPSTTGEERSLAGSDARTNDEDEANLSFEAIASAISTSLSHQSNGDARATVDGPSEVAPASSNQESLDEPGQVANNDEQQPEAPRANKARRTPGEHVAEVIDHLVDRRKQQLSEGQRPLGGPQIVVVAPVGSSSLVKSARSLVKSTDEPSQPKVAASKPAPAQKASKQASEEPTKKKKSEQSKSTKPIGARLMGSLGALQTAEAGRYSERVEVIEDDDSSGLLMKSAANEQDGNQTSADDDDDQQEQQDERQPTSSSSDAFAPMGDDFANMHVSSNSGEARLRSPRHELSASQAFERYAPMQQQQQQQFNHHHHHQQQQPQLAKLYSAEQLIREAVLKSKSRPHQQHQQPPKQVVDVSEKQKQQSNSNDQQLPTTTPATVSITTPATIGQSAPSTTTTSEPQAASTSTTTENSPAQGPQRSQEKASRQQQEPHQLRADSQQHADQYGIQSVQVPLFTRQQQQPQFSAPFRPQQQSYQAHHAAQPIDIYQPMESQQQVLQVARPAGGFASSHNQQQAAEQQQAQQQQQQQLPVFADQEFNVPAHMAESLISQIQQSPSTVTGMVNGQPAMFHAHATGQVPSHEHQFNFGAANHRQMMPAQPQMGQHMAVASSNREPHVYMQPLPSTQRQPLIQHWTQQQAAFAADMMARLAANRRHQLEQQLQSRQLMANRNGAASGAEQQAKGEKQEAAAGGGGKKSILSSVSKALRPRSLVQPMAQKAFDHLFSSFSQQAAAQQAEIESTAAAEEDEQRAAGPAQPGSPEAPSSTAVATAPPASQAAPGGPQAAPTNNQETLQGSASAPIASAALPPAGQMMLQSAADSSGGRAMRSLPIGASASQAQQVRITDQEVQESYGQMPTYQMAGGDHYGGGGGGGYHEYHQPDHDKKSKGITFHFGGGPIGGGTQLITSPMGIFRHLMIPLLPNPRVNLNGKVVFGVVLEKNTAFGPPPKKKHKFWGR